MQRLRERDVHAKYKRRRSQILFKHNIILFGIPEGKQFHREVGEIIIFCSTIRVNST